MSIHIVETQKDKGTFLKDWNTYESIVVPIWSDLNRHPNNNKLSFLFVRNNDTDFIIPFDHVDCIPIEIDLEKSETSKWIWNRKGFLQTGLNIQNTHDIQSHLYFNENQAIEFDPSDLDIIKHYYRHEVRDNMGKILPIMKWVEYLKPFVDKIESEHESTWADEVMLPILSEIENIGVRVDIDRFCERWPNSVKHLDNDIVYTEYNPYIITSRPSNRHGGINYGALNKQDGTREIIIPRKNHIFLQFDYDAYHPRIIGKLINYDLPETSVHQWLAEQYGCSYEDSKKRTFQILYGGVNDEDREIPFFEEVDKFITKLGLEAEENGYIQTPKGRKIYLDWIESPTLQKVFNYLLQATETEFNMSVLSRLKSKGYTLPLLYVYDSFLFEYGVEEGTERAKGLKKELEHFGFPVKATWGTDYSKV